MRFCNAFGGTAFFGLGLICGLSGALALDARTLDKNATPMEAFRFGFNAYKQGDKTAAAIRANVKLDFVFVGESDGRARSSGTSERGSGSSGRHEDSYTALRDAELADSGAVEVARIQARIPSSYLAETRLRIDFYRKLAMADSLPALKQIEADLRDRFGKFGDEVKALLLVTEIRIRAEQKGIISVETESTRLKCLRNSGDRDDWVQLGTRFPRLTTPKPLLRLREIITFLNNLPTP